MNHRIARAGYNITWVTSQRPKASGSGTNIARVVEQFADNLNVNKTDRFVNFVITNAVHSSGDPRSHATVAVSTESMRAKRQSIIHHIYFDQTRASKTNPEGTYCGHRIHEDAVQDPKHICNSYDTAQVRRSVFDDVPAGKTPVGYSPDMNSYYVLGTDGIRQHYILLLPHPSEKSLWYFTDPNTDQSTIAYFPEGCGIPLPSQLPTSPERDELVAASASWQTPSTSESTLYSATNSTQALLPEDTPFVTVTLKHNTYQFIQQEGKTIQSTASDWKQASIIFGGQFSPCVAYTGKKSGKIWYTLELPTK